MNSALETPVAFLVFNRPEPTRLVFERIRAARPRRLLLVADGPRGGYPGEKERCDEVRRIAQAVDWECAVQTCFSETNLGCRDRVSSGLDWVFSECDRAIVLEDDCLPDPTFFRYCEELLELYADDERVTMITGDGQDLQSNSGASYRFSAYNLIWGWASWRRAWRHYDVAIRKWPQLRLTPWLQQIVGDQAVEAYWRRVFDKVHAGEIDTWDYQWTFSSWVRGGMAIHPSVNLVSNIGFGPDATHTIGDSYLASRETKPMTFPLVHPGEASPDRAADTRLAREVHHWVSDDQPKSLVGRTRARLSRFLPKPVLATFRAGFRMIYGERRGGAHRPGKLG